MITNIVDLYNSITSLEYKSNYGYNNRFVLSIYGGYHIYCMFSTIPVTAYQPCISKN